MNLANLVAIVLLLAVNIYAVTAGADFGAGFWDLVAGGTRRGAAPRALIDRAVGPVWEVNHVWLIFCLVVLWTAFGPAFASIMTTLSIPLSLAALGIILRGTGFAFRQEAERLNQQRLFGGIFALSSLLTPFFLGTVVGGIAGGRVPVGNAAGDLITSWLNPTSVLIGILAVASCAYLSAVFLVTDAKRLDADELDAYFRRRAVGAAAFAGLLALIGVFVLDRDDAFLFQGLATRGWVLMLISGLCGLITLWLVHANARRATRVLAVGAVSAVVWGWGVAQYPYLLPQTLTIAQAAAPAPTLAWLALVTIAAVLLVVPSLVLVFRLDQQSRLEEPTPLEITMNENRSFPDPSAPHVVIVGGGFGGVATAKALKNVPVRVTLVDRTNYHLFQPLLYQVAAGVLEPGTITTPIRALFRKQKNVDVRMATVVGVDKDARRVLLDGGQPAITYDYLVLSTGVQGSYFGHDEWAPLAPGMKTLADAEALRRKIVGTLEAAEQEDDPARRAELLTFVLVGAGPTGCELAGELAESFAHGLSAEYRRIDPRDARIIVAEAGPRALPTFSESLSRGATEKLRKMGVEMRVGQAVQMVDPEGVVIGGERIRTRTVLWTAGVQASPAASWLGAEADRAGRAVVLPDLTLKGHPEIFVIGDTAHIDHNGKPLPGVAQVALQGGKYAGHTIRARVLHQPPLPPFKYFDKGSMATVSVTYAIVENRGLKLSGLLGKIGWAFIHVFYLGSAESQVQFGMQFLFGLVSGRMGARYIDTPTATVQPAAPRAEPPAGQAVSDGRTGEGSPPASVMTP